ncbi:alanine--tRNA ligase [candidate division WWE3 bacterium]|nr:alanine--tRNA ligase [candidate division WWE3 bacterium]
MRSQDILSKYISFYQNRQHKLIPNMSLVPEGDSTLLFVNSGMFPLVPYLSGEKHPAGSRLVNVQRALRFEDLEEIGDYNHTTCFHMIGNWSLGDYFKKDQLPWVYQFFVEEIGLDVNRLYATVFEGDNYAPRDDESIAILQDIFAKYGVDAKVGERIFACGRKDNWWQRGDAPGELGGPDSEVFYYIGKDGNGLGKSPAENDSEFLEIGNSVFMQYRRTHDGGWETLPQKNVDFGGGLERITLVSDDKSDIYQTDMFEPIIHKVEELSGRLYGKGSEDTKAMRILADHIRTATFLAMDGVVPSNKDQGYVLRRFLRRIVRFGRKLGVYENISVRLVSTVAETLQWMYPELIERQPQITSIFGEEEQKFSKTLDRGLREVEKRLERGDDITEMAFEVYQSVGFPIEMFIEVLEEKGINFDRHKIEDQYHSSQSQHQAGSRAGAEQKFKGGLADQSDEVVKYHTATHLLHWALREVLGTDVSQRGSNITGERLRFDFNYSDKLSDEQIKQIELLINQKITDKIPVNYVILPKDKAEESGALHFFGEKYGDQVKVYYIGDDLESAFSKEFCGGPHVSNTDQIGKLELYKQESVGKGVRRVYVRVQS